EVSQGLPQPQMPKIEMRDAVIGAVLAVSVIWLCAMYFPFWLGFQEADLDARSSSVSALFGGLAFVCVVITLFYQKDELKHQVEELKLQRKELELTRQELKRSAEAQEANAEHFQAASMRQSREQFLTARLNTQVALLQADEALTQIHAAAAEYPAKNLG